MRYLVQKVQLIYFDAHDGHRAAAQAIQALVALEKRPWLVTLVSLSHVLQRGLAFKDKQDADYLDDEPQQPRRHWASSMKRELMALQASFRLAHPSLFTSLQQHWAATKPDLVVSLIPSFSRALQESLVRCLPGVPFMTVMTDLAESPPRPSTKVSQRHAIVCVSTDMRDQALTAGHTSGDLTVVQGAILRPEFYEAPAGDRGFTRRAMRLHPQRPTGLVMFGSHGSNQMLTIAKALSDVQVIFICGGNPSLAMSLRKWRERLRAPHVIIEYTSRVRHFMDLCDFFVGPPGSVCTSEALQRGLPVLSWVEPTATPHAQRHANWLRDERLGLILSGISELRGGYQAMMKELPAFAARVRNLDNHAVYAVVDAMAQHGVRMSPIAPPWCHPALRGRRGDVCHGASHGDAASWRKQETTPSDRRLGSIA